MTIILHQIPASGPCRAVIMTAEKLGIDLVKKYVDLFSGEQLKPEFLMMNPQHCVPTIEDDGFYLWESRAIMIYLVNKYASGNPLYPEDPKERAVVDRMLYFDLGSLYKAQTDYLIPVLFEKRSGEPEKEENYKKVLDLLNGFLSKTAYVAGNHLTLADYSVLSTLSFGVEIGDYDISAYPKITAWLQKLKAEIPNYKEIHEIPLRIFKEFMESEKYRELLEARKKKHAA